MLLETMDMTDTRILIYSQNKFDFNSFRIIDKDSKPRRPKKINYFAVCDHIKSVCPKNLVLYRLRTNVQTIDPYSTKFGYFIKMESGVELVYFDPVFAIKDLKHLKFDLDPDQFRFKIQQIGLQSVNTKDKEAVYKEVYSFDMRAIEAQFQNDRIFADAIFALDPDYISEDEETENAASNPSVDELDKSDDDVKDSIADLSHIREESGKDDIQQELPKFNTGEANESLKMREDKINLLKQALGIEEEEPVISQNEPNVESTVSTDDLDEIDETEIEPEAESRPKEDRYSKKFDEAAKREEYFYITNIAQEADDNEDEIISGDDEILEHEDEVVKDILNWNFSDPPISDTDKSDSDSSAEGTYSAFIERKKSESVEKKLMKQLDVLDLFKAKKRKNIKRESVILKLSKS